MTRLVYRPLHETGKILQVGMSAAVMSPQYSSTDSLNHKQYTLAANFPTRISKLKAVSRTINEAQTLYKFTPELLAAYGRLALETQYYYTHINRKGTLPRYKASGVYAAVRGLIKEHAYQYSNNDGCISTPEGGNMELVAAYNYTDLSDHKAGIRGGRSNDWSLTYNYYINKYVLVRVRGSYTRTTDRAGYDDKEVKILETRLQIKF